MPRHASSNAPAANTAMMSPKNSCSHVVRLTHLGHRHHPNTGNAGPDAAQRFTHRRDQSVSGAPCARTSIAIEREPLVAYGT